MLRVTKLTDYATVVMAQLATHDTIMSASELADKAGLEVPTVAKILKMLAQAQLIDAFRGSNGGYKLARSADEVNLYDIVECMEGPLGMTECSLDESHCGIEHACTARANWRRINDVIIDALRAVTLNQLVSGQASPSMSSKTPNSRLIPARLTAS